MGMGDVRLAALTGLVLGTAGWHTVLIGATGVYLLTTPFAVAALRSRKAALPFGPFLVAATILAGIIAPPAAPTASRTARNGAFMSDPEFTAPPLSPVERR
jgi:leader peptidase (prepilin peptidase)/N-methyltransferase